MLAASGIAGDPQSYFHGASLAEWRDDIGLLPSSDTSHRAGVAELFDVVMTQGRSGTAIFGLRLQWHSFDLFIRHLCFLYPNGTNQTGIDAAFGRTLFIHLTREDKLAQAISYVKALQSGLWHKAPDGTEVERLAPPKDPHYDAPAIAKHVHQFREDDRAWQNWFSAEKINPLRFTYDALSGDLSGTVGRIMVRLGLDPKAAQGIVPPVAKLLDDQSARWAVRFKAEHTGK